MKVSKEDFENLVEQINTGFAIRQYESKLEYTEDITDKVIYMELMQRVPLEKVVLRKTFTSCIEDDAQAFEYGRGSLVEELTRLGALFILEK